MGVVGVHTCRIHRTLTGMPEHGSLSFPDHQSIKLLGPLVLAVPSDSQCRVSKLLFGEGEHNVSTAPTFKNLVNEYEVSTIGR